MMPQPTGTGSPPPLPSDRSRHPTGRAGVMALLAAALAVGQLPPPPGRSAPILAPEAVSCALPAPSVNLAGIARTPPATRLRPGRPARPILLDLAQRIGSGSCEAIQGKYDVVRHRAWYYPDSTTDVVRWYADDDSGAELKRQHPWPYTGVMHDFWPPGWLSDKNLRRAFYSTDRLRFHARRQTAQVDEATGFLAGLTALTTWHNPGQPQRALAVRVLADTPELTAHLGTLDHAGRAGIGVRATSDGGHRRALLILDPHTGAVLAYERATLTPTGWQTVAYLLLLDRTHAESRYWEPTARSATDSPPVDPREMPREAGTLLVTPAPCTPQGAP